MKYVGCAEDLTTEHRALRWDTKKGTQIQPGQRSWKNRSNPNASHISQNPPTRSPRQEAGQGMPSTTHCSCSPRVALRCRCMFHDYLSSLSLSLSTYHQLRRVWMVTDLLPYELHKGSSTSKLVQWSYTQALFITAYIYLYIYVCTGALFLDGVQ